MDSPVTIMDHDVDEWTARANGPRRRRPTQEDVLAQKGYALRGPLGLQIWGDPFPEGGTSGDASTGTAERQARISRAMRDSQRIEVGVDDEGSPFFPEMSLAEDLADLARAGYRASFTVVTGGTLRCISCGTGLSPESLPVHEARRVEGPTDPADETIVLGMECPACGARGAIALPFGPRAGRDEARALGGLDLGHARRAN